MKLSRPALKALIKECLIEILTDGLGGQLDAAVSSSDVSVSESRRRSQVSQAQAAASRRPASQPQGSNSKIPTAALKEAIKRESHGNSVLADMLADTAVTTLPGFLSSQGPGGGGNMPMPGQGIAEQVMAKATPEEIFGEDSTSRWADLAFMDAPAKKSA